MEEMIVQQQQVGEAGNELRAFERHAGGQELVLAFGSTQRLQNPDTYRRLRESFPGATLAGCTTAGEIAGTEISDETLTVTSLRFNSTAIRTHRVRVDSMAASFEAGAELIHALYDDSLAYVLILSDGLAVNGSALVKGVYRELPPSIPCSGGLAGDGPRFQRTLTLDDDGIHEKSVIAVGFYGKALRIGRASVGGWAPFGPFKTVTKSKDNIVYELDGRRALDVYSAYLGDEAAQLPASGLLFPLAITSERGAHGLIRTLLAIDSASGSLTFAGDVPQGTAVQLMHASYEQLIEGAGFAAEHCLADGGLERARFALLISCVGRKLMMGNNTDLEVDAVVHRLGSAATTAGFYSYGEIGPFGSGGMCDLHNQTMTVTVFDTCAA